MRNHCYRVDSGISNSRVAVIVMKYNSKTEIGISRILRGSMYILLKQKVYITITLIKPGKILLLDDLYHNIHKLLLSFLFQVEL